MGKIVTCVMVLLILVFASIYELQSLASGLSIHPMEYVSYPSLHDMAGDKIDRIQVGQQSVVGLTVHNNNSTEQSMVILIEVRDDSDVTIDLFWQTSKIEAKGNYTMETSWTPSKVGTNSIRSFAFTDFENPQTQILSEVVTLDGITVVEQQTLPWSVTLT